MKRIASLALAFACVSIIHAQTIRLSQSNPSGVYRAGEKIAVTATISADSPVGEHSILVTIRKNNGNDTVSKTVVASTDSVTLFEDAFDAPCSIIVEAKAGNAHDAIGAIVEPADIKPGAPRPANFESYWKARLEAAAAVPLDTKWAPIKLDAASGAYQAFHIEVNSPGPRPARGIFAKPANAAPNSLPIVLQLRAAGVKGEWCRSHLNEALDLAKKGSGALAFDLNAHGMLNGQPESYYEELENGPLKNYWEIAIENRDEYYFGYMYLRMLRTIEFLTRQPEWDGQRILVIGESQGGGQALAAAGLDPRVTAVVATVPALCDLSAPLVGRKGGWPQPVDWHRDNPKVIETVGYFDAASLLVGSKATLVVEVGLIDQDCPATSIYAAINQAKGKKTIFNVPYRAHGWPEPPHRSEWDNAVFAPKWDFISDYLK